MSLEYRVDHRGHVELQAPRKRPRCCFYLSLVLALLLLALGWLIFNGYLLPSGSVGSLRAFTLHGQLTEQKRLLAEREEDIVQLESQVAAAQRERQIQESANKKLRRKLLLAEGELAEASQRLVLYEDILTPSEETPQGLQVRHLGLQERTLDEDGNPLEGGRFYQYHLVLAHVRGGDAVVSGRFAIKLTGKLDGKEHELALAEMSEAVEPQPELKFSLKYYQSIEGTLALPPGFAPEKVIVVLTPEGNSNATVTESYDWNSFKLSQKSTAS